MVDTIVVPPGSDGDDVHVELIPQLHRLSISERRETQ